MALRSERVFLLLSALVLSSGCGLLLDLDPPIEDAPPPPPPPPPGLELCNGADDDVDGLVDEDPVDEELGAPCFEGPPGLEGVGQCIAGAVGCVGGAPACEGWIGPSPEACDGLDTDCDGTLLPAEATDACGVPEPNVVMLDHVVTPLTPDVHVNFDTTGSMAALFDRFEAGHMSFVGVLRALDTDTAFGISSFADFPLGAFGDYTDRPYVLHQRITTDLAAFTSAVSVVPDSLGSDADEAAVESLYQIATGAGIAWAPGPFGGASGAVPAMDCSDGFDATLGHGTIGGVCFRAHRLPVIAHVTDAGSHVPEEYLAGGTFAPAPAEPDAAAAALRAIGAHVIGLWASPAAMGSPPERYPIGMVEATFTILPPCVFDGTYGRVSGRCAPGMCCTGLDAIGRPPRADGVCPLLFDVDRVEEHLRLAMATGVELLARYKPQNIALSFSGDPTEVGDASCFVDSVIFFATATGSCAPPPMIVDTDGDGESETLLGAIAGTPISVELTIANTDTRDLDGDGDATERCAGPGTYGLVVSLTDSTGREVYSSTTPIRIP